MRRRLGYLRELGIGAIQLMPPFEFAGDRSWGYNPAYPFAVESAYGHPDDLKALVRAAHEAGIAVLLDVVYNHLGPSDLDLWRFDGWSENDKGGIYFYQDDRSATPWGDTRPDYGRHEVRAFLRDNAMTWLDEFRIDGLRWDATAYISSITGGGSGAADRIAEGWELMAAINARGGRALPRPAHDRRGPAQRPGRDARPRRRAAQASARNGIRASCTPCARRSSRRATRRATSTRSPAPCMVDPADAFKRVIYTESHDEVANGSSRVPEEIWPGYADSWPSRKRAALGAALVLTAPGIPMLFQGQELIEGSWFTDEEPLDWSKRHRHAGLLQLHRDLIRLRRNGDDTTRGLRGPRITVHHRGHDARVLAYHRWEAGGPRDDVIVAGQPLGDPIPRLPRRCAAGRPLAGALQQRLGGLRP